MADDATRETSLVTKRSIQEFWMDFLLEEEFSATPEFCCEFLKECASELQFVCVGRVAHSVSHTDGEVDLVVILVVKRADGVSAKIALLVEDKITAGFQPDQARRYELFGEHGKTTGAWESYCTVLVAPHAYINLGHGFQRSIPYEVISTWVCPSDPMRRAFKQRRIAEAIAKKNATGVQKVDPVVTAFRAEYFKNLQDFNKTHGTDFDMSPPKDAYDGELWFFLNSRSLPNQSAIRHRPRSGYIELIFRNTPFDETQKLEEVLETGMTRISMGKYNQHVAIQMIADRIFEFDDFGRVRAKIDAALNSAESLLRLFERERAKIEHVVISARQARQASRSETPR